MAQDLLYLPSYKNVQKLFEKIAKAKTPDAFTHRFLTQTLGLKSTGDRALISLLKSLGFLDASGRPTKSYGLLKSNSTAGGAIAEGVRKAYEPLFSANENAYELPASELRGHISSVAGSDANTTSKIAGTFNALVRIADFSASLAEPPAKPSSREALLPEAKTDTLAPQIQPGFYYNIQVHLPSNASEETYLNIFSALRKAFK